MSVVYRSSAQEWERDRDRERDREREGGVAHFLFTEVVECLSHLRLVPAEWVFSRAEPESGLLTGVFAAVVPGLAAGGCSIFAGVREQGMPRWEPKETGVELSLRHSAEVLCLLLPFDLTVSFRDAQSWAGKWGIRDLSQHPSDSKTGLPRSTEKVCRVALLWALVWQKENMKKPLLFMGIHKSIVSFHLEVL